MTKVQISDHALVRWLERVHDIDMDWFRAKLAEIAQPYADARVKHACDGWIYDRSLEHDWKGFIWMNPPFGGRNGIVPWMDKFFAHGSGVALTPDRTSAPWWQQSARRADAVLFVSGKIRFIKPDGTVGKSPSTGTTLFAAGGRGVEALKRAQKSGLGWLAVQHG